MKKLILIISIVLMAYSVSTALGPVRVAIIKTDGTAPFAVIVELNDYTGGTVSNIFPSTSMGNLTPNSSGIMSFIIEGAAWTAIASANVNSYYVVDVKVDGTLFAQYRLDELMILQAQTGDGTAMANGAGAFESNTGTITAVTSGEDLDMEDNKIVNVDELNGNSTSNTIKINSLISQDIGNENTAFGLDALINNTGNNVTAIGFNSAHENTGNYVTANGSQAAYQNTGDYVTASGYSSAYKNTGDYVTASGYRSARWNTGDYVTASGYSSAYQNQGGYVTAAGYYSAYLNTGNFVTASGYSSAYQNQGGNVTATGYHSAYQNIGDNVTTSGFRSAYKNTGDNVLALGSNAGWDGANGNTISNVTILPQTVLTAYTDKTAADSAFSGMTLVSGNYYLYYNQALGTVGAYLAL
ncbi:MAG: hypothetical protein WC121_04290 [Candidatus Kapaibacterium sp.]